MKKIIISFLIMLAPFYMVDASKSGKCIPPTKLKELDKILANKISSIKKTDKEVVSDVFWGYKYELINRIIDKTFSKEYKDAFNNYIENFKKIEASYQEGLLSKDEIKTRDFHYYILADTIPVLLNDRLFFDVRSVSPERDLERQASQEKVWMELNKELDSRNLKICKDEESIEQDMEVSGGNKEYKTILEDPWLRTIDFNANYEIPIVVSENFLSDPESNKISDKKGVLGWMKSKWNIITGNEEDREKEMQKESIENQITSSSISPKTKLFLAFERGYNIESRYLDWRNDRNFWIKKTNQISGYNLDVFVEKYEIMLDNILKTNEELSQSLKAIEVICQSQRENIPCWLTGNIIPKHSNSNEKSYEYRTAESDN